MDTLTIKAVQASWSQMKPIADVAGALFYKNLFDAEPALRPLFRGDVDAQAAKLMQMISTAVGKLDELDTLVPILQSLGARHGTYGVHTSHYDTVGDALLKTLA